MYYFIFSVSSLIFISGALICRSLMKLKFPLLSDLYIFYSSLIISLAKLAISLDLYSYEFIPFIPTFDREFKDYLNNYFLIILFFYIAYILFRKGLIPNSLNIKIIENIQVKLNKRILFKANLIQGKYIIYLILSILLFVLPIQVEAVISLIGIPLAVSDSISTLNNNRISKGMKFFILLPILTFVILCFRNYVSSKRYFIIPLLGSIVIFGTYFIKKNKAFNKLSFSNIILIFKIILTFLGLVFSVLVMQILRVEGLTKELFFLSVKSLFEQPLASLEFLLRYLEAGNIGIHSFDFLHYTLDGDIKQFDIGTYGKILGLGFIPFTGQKMGINDIYTGYIDPIGRAAGNSSPIINLVTFSSYNWLIGFSLFLLTLWILDWMQFFSFKILKKFQIIGWTISFYACFQLGRGIDLSTTIYTSIVTLLLAYFITRFIEYRY